jgi:type IV secretory pathway VirB6-like protein
MVPHLDSHAMTPGEVQRLRSSASGKALSDCNGREKSMDFIIAARDCGGGVATILWIIAAVLVIFGIITLVRGAILYGIALIVIGLLIGPGGVSIFC